MNRIDALLPSALPTGNAKSSASQISEGFAGTLEQFVGQVDQMQQSAERKAEALQAGQPVELHDVLISAEKADIAMRLLMTMRNHVVDAYQEVMRMQI